MSPRQPHQQVLVLLDRVFLSRERPTELVAAFSLTALLAAFWSAFDPATRIIASILTIGTVKWLGYHEYVENERHRNWRVASVKMREFLDSLSLYGLIAFAETQGLDPAVLIRRCLKAHMDEKIQGNSSEIDLHRPL